MRCDRAAEITGQEDRAEDRGRRDRVENGADQCDDTKASRQRFARTIADPVHRFRDNGPRHQLDGAVEQHEHNNETAENPAHPDRGFRHRIGPCHVATQASYDLASVIAEISGGASENATKSAARHDSTAWASFAYSAFARWSIKVRISVSSIVLLS